MSLPKLPQKAPDLYSLWRHKKTNGVYVVLGYTMIEATWTLGIRYARVGHEGLDITRCAKEFMDGRFEPVSEIMWAAPPVEKPS